MRRARRDGALWGFRLPDLTAPRLLAGNHSPMHAHHTAARHSPAWRKIAIALVAITALAAVWRFTPLAEYLTPRSLAAWARVLRQSTWAPIALVVSFPGCVHHVCAAAPHPDGGARLRAVGRLVVWHLRRCGRHR